MSDTDFSRMLTGYTLTTAEILYRLPDHPSLLQTYLWQDYDLHPKFPKLKSFLDFWEANLDGKLYKVSVNHRHLVSPAELKLVGNEFKLH
ncbi:Protein usg [Candidatus Filomicrobium marinum]|uniref:Protein usg n=2 Tax=Filomicrobium TaxID=119044 RepID=A0A0D6JAA6_9HYPH|nr:MULTISPECIES: usg protein [Filomicrobium]MCV0368644.1 usg protein [Filomicrobium sp.]CFX00607.1 Protein usg [Candidatus Filomicrobium marinum]CPR15274.1 Protein usg [Candidatus Filomicrobium marinum]SDO67885.1 Usg protein (tryptophan operon, function unknown) [Filomicrobium insigne]